MTPKQFGKKIAAELKADPKRWIKGYLALDQNRSSALADSEHAVCWCLEGFVFREMPFDIEERVAFREAASRVLGDAKPDFGISSWNDAPERTVGDVINLLEKIAA